ncbi:uncharacterized protein LOC131322574 [Rhododendron vialii]|uniref:uncharacterized protein LOC131322574 n=1 Tax=Rhododendron vialii TaxID=182163 RepID=UPI00265EB4E4|nr:uncharacterized protein LOC131322574 [Rhododendron vialii]
MYDFRVKAASISMYMYSTIVKYVTDDRKFFHLPFSILPAVLLENLGCTRKESTGMSSSHGASWQYQYEQGSSSSDGDDMMIMDMLSSSDDERQPQRNAPFTGQEYVTHLLNGHQDTIQDVLRVDAPTFRSLVAELVLRGNLKWDHMHLSVEESLATFLYICGQSGRHRTVADRFQHSTDTICRHFKYMRRALCTLAPFIIRPPDLNVTPPEIINDQRFYPWFKDCIGAIDGTHIEAWVPTTQETAYRGRKATKTQNVMAACSFDMKFTFVYPGWEGSAHDSRVFLAAVTNPNLNFPHPPINKYYVVDSGYTNMPGYLAPYRGERYHLNQYNGPNPVYNSHRELFNHRHSSLRNVIERCFGVLKRRFPILKSMPSYKPVRQPSIVTACCVVHNWIIIQRQRDLYFDSSDDDDDEEEDGGDIEVVNMSRGGLQQMANRRDEIATQLWNAHNW